LNWKRELAPRVLIREGENFGGFGFFLDFWLVKAKTSYKDKLIISFVV